MKINLRDPLLSPRYLPLETAPQIDIPNNSNKAEKISRAAGSAKRESKSQN